MGNRSSTGLFIGYQIILGRENVIQLLITIYIAIYDLHDMLRNTNELDLADYKTLHESFKRGRYTSWSQG
jgi:hypothetical protein